jgi:hypothetical protein
VAYELKLVEEAEQPAPEYNKIGEYVHVVTTQLFDIARVFQDRDDALHYALQIFKAIEQTTVLTYDDYREEYGQSHHVYVQAADRNCMVNVTVRKLRVRRDKCYLLGNE